MCRRLRGRHAGEGGEEAARNFENFMESTFPCGYEAGPSSQAQAGAQAAPEGPSSRPGSSSRPTPLQVHSV